MKKAGFSLNWDWQQKLQCKPGDKSKTQLKSRDFNPDLWDFLRHKALIIFLIFQKVEKPCETHVIESGDTAPTLHLLTPEEISANANTKQMFLSIHP